MSHPEKIPGWEGTLKELAQHLENLRYDRLEEFLSHLYTALSERAAKDQEAGRINLAKQLLTVCTHVNLARLYLLDAWDT